MILLDRVRDDIHETKKLNVHLFNALKKALYKPAAWFKGFLFPMVESGCTLRDAHIISAVLARVSIPVLHSGAALKGLCDIAALEASAGSEGGGGKPFFPSSSSFLFYLKKENPGLTIRSYEYFHKDPLGEEICPSIPSSRHARFPFCKSFERA